MPLTVNGEEITEADLRGEEEQLRPRLREAMPEESASTLEERTIEWARENAIERVLLRQAAMADPEPLAEGALEAAVAQNPTQSPAELEAQLRLERYTARLTNKLVPPRAKEVSEYYRQHREEFVIPELVRAAHIVKNLDEQSDADAVLEHMRAVESELQQGADFAEVADRLSDCPGRGGDLGFFARGQMVEEFDEVVFSLVPGQISVIFRTPFGYHIAKLLERKPEGPRPFGEVKDAIEGLLYDQKKQRRIEQCLDSLRAKADIRQ